jgi:hypothetical protein
MEGTEGTNLVHKSLLKRLLEIASAGILLRFESRLLLVELFALPAIRLRFRTTDEIRIEDKP